MVSERGNSVLGEGFVEAIDAVGAFLRFRAFRLTVQNHIVHGISVGRREAVRLLAGGRGQHGFEVTVGIGLAGHGQEQFKTGCVWNCVERALGRAVCGHGRAGAADCEGSQQQCQSHGAFLHLWVAIGGA